MRIETNAASVLLDTRPDPFKLVQDIALSEKPGLQFTHVLRDQHEKGVFGFEKLVRPVFGKLKLCGNSPSQSLWWERNSAKSTPLIPAPARMARSVTLESASEFAMLAAAGEGESA